METIIKKWGNSLGIRIPKPLSNQIAVKEGSKVNIELKNNKLILTSTEEEYILEDLLAKITTDNIHKEMEVSERIGKEIW